MPMLPLSPKTETLIAVVFRDQSHDHQRHIAQLLQKEVGQNLPFCDSHTSEGMERLRFAVIRLIAERGLTEAMAIDLAKRDWRDLLMFADFGYDAHAHVGWYYDVIRRPGG